jgi:hypothetical protein
MSYLEFSALTVGLGVTILIEVCDFHSLSKHTAGIGCPTWFERVLKNILNNGGGEGWEGRTLYK